MTGERRSRVVLFRVCLSCVLQSWALGVGLADGRVSGLLQGASARALNLKLNPFPSLLPFKGNRIVREPARAL